MSTKLLTFVYIYLIFLHRAHRQHSCCWFFQCFISISICVAYRIFCSSFWPRIVCWVIFSVGCFIFMCSRHHLPRRNHTKCWAIQYGLVSRIFLRNTLLLCLSPKWKCMHNTWYACRFGGEHLINKNVMHTYRAKNANMKSIKQILAHSRNCVIVYWNCHGRLLTTIETKRQPSENEGIVSIPL